MGHCDAFGIGYTIWLTIDMHVYSMRTSRSRLPKMYNKGPIALPNFLSHMQDPLKPQTNLIAIANNLNHTIINTLFLIINIFISL